MILPEAFENTWSLRYTLDNVSSNNIAVKMSSLGCSKILLKKSKSNTLYLNVFPSPTLNCFKNGSNMIATGID